MCEHLQKLADEFAIPIATLQARQRTAYAEAQDLVIAERGAQDRQHLLTPRAADAWRQMRQAAARDGMTIFIVSAFRSIERQTQIVRRKLTSGMGTDQLLAVSALPGYSEHHTGRAVDIGTPQSVPLEEAFKDTPAFAWLQARAAEFNFRLSYPAGNPEGYVFEPWHWCHERD